MPAVLKVVVQAKDSNESHASIMGAIWPSLHTIRQSMLSSSQNTDRRFSCSSGMPFILGASRSIWRINEPFQELKGRTYAVRAGKKKKKRIMN